MLKLKIGENYLLTNYDKAADVDRNGKLIIYKYISFMASCFKNINCLAIGLYHSDFMDLDLKLAGLAKEINNTNYKVVYVLYYNDICYVKNYNSSSQASAFIQEYKREVKTFLKKIHSILPDITFKIIEVNKYDKDPRLKLGFNLVNSLREKPDSVLHDLRNLELYKAVSLRNKQIPNEIQIIDNDIENYLKKTSLICQYTTTLKSLQYLKLIDEIEIQGTDLVVTLLPLPIYPSEPLGLVFSGENFNSNPYLYKAASYIYSGCHFGMGATKIRITKEFRLQWIETIDKRFDNMLKYNNWSGAGYCHFGSRGFCAGEFNDAMAHGKEYGLTYFFTALKQYLTTANMRDLAGYKVWWYPIYNENNEMVYCAGLDIYIQEYLKNANFPLYEEVQGLSWEERATRLKDHSNYGAGNTHRYSGGTLSYQYRGPDAFLEKAQRDDPVLYSKIQERMNK